MAFEELQADVAELQQVTGLTVDIVPVGIQVFLILRRVLLPPGAYRVAATDVLFITDQQYRLSAMDMFWTGSTSSGRTAPHLRTATRSRPTSTVSGGASPGTATGPGIRTAMACLTTTSSCRPGSPSTRR
jgi:hypothetical protein